jgi:LCP family protein required for cell wall assembly
MDNFRKPKRVVNTSNVDGLMRGRMRRSAESSHAKDGYSSANSQEKTSESRIGNFARKEGFIARKTKPIMPDGRSLGRQPKKLVEPINMHLEDSPKNKKRRAGKGSRNWKKIALRGTLAMFLIVVLVGGYLGFKGYLRARSVFKGGGESVAWKCEPNPSVLKKEGDGRVNFLLLGKGGPEQTDGPNLTDTIIVASVDPCNKEAGLLSIPRDLAVKMESGETQKINAVYALTKMSAESKGKSPEDAEKAGIEAIENVVENVVGLKINYYTMIDFEAFEQAINAVGGVDIDVKEPVFENMSLKGKPYKLKVETGNQHFDGLKALAYSRCRHCDERSDFGRSERQREVIIALRRKIISLGTFGNPVKLSQLIDSFGTRVTTNLSVPDEALKLYAIGQEIDEANIKSVSLVDEPNVLIGTGSSNLGLGSIQIPKAGIYKYDEIQKYVRNTFIDGFLKKENAGVVVLNGTSVSGLATTKSDVLKSYGYNVLDVGDAPSKNNPNTIIVDLKKKDTKYTKRYLELRYKTTVTSELPEGITPPENADFVIILGQNETSNR